MSPSEATITTSSRVSAVLADPELAPAGRSRVPAGMAATLRADGEPASPSRRSFIGLDLPNLRQDQQVVANRPVRNIELVESDPFVVADCRAPVDLPETSPNYAFHYGMYRFYRKHYAHRRAWPANAAVYAGILAKLVLSLGRAALRRRLARLHGC